MPKQEQNNRLILFLLVFTLVIVAVGYFQFKRSIYAPFGIISKKQTSSQVQQELSSLVLQDTDFDGLTDFDEQFVYNTSAYIADTDSDAYSDKEEIDAGSNPLDKKSTPYTISKEPGLDKATADKATSSREASADAKASSSAKATADRLADKTAGKEEILEKIFPAPETNNELSIITDQLFGEGDVSVQEIRDLLINSGIDKDIVDKIDDKTLKTLYNEAAQETAEKLTAPNNN